jgi:hypothetical protein
MVVQRSTRRWNWKPTKVIGAAILVVLAASVGSGLAVRQYTRVQLQDVAEDAALAGAKALRDGSGDNASQRRQAVAVATRAVARRIDGASISVAASVSPAFVSVRISDASSRLSRVAGGIEVVADAGYVQPQQDSGEINQVPLYNRLKPTITTAHSQW